MVSICSTLRAGGTCTNNACRKRHDVSRCEVCEVFVPHGSLEEHRSGQRHLQNVAANGTPIPVEPQRSPTPPSDISISQLASPPGASSSASSVQTPITSDRSVTVSHESGLDFVAEGTEIAGQLSFPSVSLVILIEKTEVASSRRTSLRVSIPAVRLLPATGTPESCFTASVSGEVVRRSTPRKILVSFQAPHAGTFHTSLQIVFNYHTRSTCREFIMFRELRGCATLPSGDVGSHSPEPASLPSPSSPAISVLTDDPSFTVSHESGLDFVVVGTGIAEQPSFSPVSLTILIEDIQVVSIPTLKLFPAAGTPESCFTASVSRDEVSWNEPCKILVSFQAPHVGTFRTCLQITLDDNTWEDSRKINVLRELRGRATLPGNQVGSAHLQESFLISNEVDDHAALSMEEEGVLPDSQGTGISVSNEDVVDFGIVERDGLNGLFSTLSSSVTINHAEGFPAVTFVDARIRSWDGSDSSFRANLEGDSLTIHPGTERTVQINFIPKFEGWFEATLELIFAESQHSGHFAVYRELQAIAGSFEDHEWFESIDQDGYIPRSGSGHQIPPEKVIPLSRPAQRFGNLPAYELPLLVQEAVDSATFEHPYDEKGLIATLKPRDLSMDTYAKYFTALLNVEEGHQQRDILDQPPFEVDVQMGGSRYFVEFEDEDEDLLPEVFIGDFLWLEDRQEDMYYDARIVTADVSMRGPLAVLKVLLEVPASFDPYRGAQFLLRFRLNRITLRRQYHALASPFAHLRRLLFPSTSDIKSIQRLSEAEVAELPLFNEDIREDDQQLQTVVSILQQPKGTVPFIIFGPPGTGKTSTVVESIMQLVRSDASLRILACTPSNAAADLLVERLAGAGLSVDQLLRLNARSRDINSIPEDVRAFSASPKPAKLRTYRVVLTTCSSAALLQTLKIRAGHFSHIVIDEAAQAEEPLSFIPIATFANEDTNVILAGDPHQLGPVIRSGPASEAGLGKSYLERLMLISDIYAIDTQAGNTIVGLQRNRRSHGAIIAWPNRYLYEDIMQARASEDISHLLLQSDVLPREGFPIVFHGIKGRERRKRNSPSYLNILEASVVRDYCQRLTRDREHKIYAEEIGVVAPYKAQVRTIRELLKLADLNDVSVGSVEQFQGQERKVIIVATTRSNKEVSKGKAMGFLQDRRRMNVAITRAQALLIVVGDPEVLGTDELWRTFLNYACLCGGWRGKEPSWKAKGQVHLPDYDVIPRPGGVVYGESYIDGKSKEIYKYFK